MIAPPPIDCRRLRRRIVRIERELSRWRPTAPTAPDPPDGAVEVLAALARARRPGDRVGIRDLAEFAGISRDAAEAIRRWASHRAVGRWPYRHGSPRYAGRSDRPDRERYGEP